MPYDNIKSPKKQGFAPSIENTVLQNRRGWGQIDPFAFFLKLILRIVFYLSRILERVRFLGLSKAKNGHGDQLWAPLPAE